VPRPFEPTEVTAILTPSPGPAPRINGPKVYGGRPGHPFLYRIPAQGERPMTFSADGLPAGLALDRDTGMITGDYPQRGDYAVTLTAANQHGQDRRPFKIVSGDTLALTPPMGWNSWYAHKFNISDRVFREAADLLVSNGMADVGYQYVNIDDGWANGLERDASWSHNDPTRIGPHRDASGNILPNRHFPDMKALTDYIHSKGLKTGIYTSPGPITCTGFAGAWQHEVQDAKRFADWGFDFLKHDWCSYGDIFKQDPDPELVKHKKPYALMGGLLARQERDLVFSLCQYGWANSWEWAAEVGGQCWRTANDLGNDLSRAVREQGDVSVPLFKVALENAEHREWSRPGAWNDPDYLFFGETEPSGKVLPYPFTPHEKYAFMSLWCLMAAPLFYSGKLAELDAFTLNLLCNPEVIEVDQDPLGQCARVITFSDETFAMIKDMEACSKALGLFNRGRSAPTDMAITWSDAGMNGPQRVRDLWRQKDLGNFTGEFRTEVPPGGVVLVRLEPSR